MEEFDTGDTLGPDADACGGIAGDLLECGVGWAGDAGGVSVSGGSGGILDLDRDCFAGRGGGDKWAAAGEGSAVGDEGHCNAGDGWSGWNCGVTGIIAVGS